MNNQALEQLIRAPGKKRILSCDGGGILGLLAVEVLAELEAMLRRETGQPELVLGDWFHFCAGTSTGALIAACVSSGMPTERIRKFYLDNGRDMFDKASLLERLYYSYEREPLAQQLKREFGDDTLMGTERLRTLLMVVTRNATTDSPWPITNNPFAAYNSTTLDDCNLKLPLWQVLRASTAAPTYFPPERVKIGGKTFMFVDGGVTTYNNPALLAFATATAQPYAVNWQTGEDEMLIVSLGCGHTAVVRDDTSTLGPHVLGNAVGVIGALMNAATAGQDLMCRVLGKCVHGGPIDSEVGTLIGATGPTSPKLFTYLRYDADTSAEGLAALGLSHIDPKKVQTLDAVEAIPEIRELGRAVARGVRVEDYAGFI